jgi:hypothetical protein
VAATCSEEKYSFIYRKQGLVVNFLEESHRIMKKSFEAEMYVDGNKLHPEQFCAGTIGNIMMGFSKTLKGRDAEAPDLIEIKIRRLKEPAAVDSHIYPIK